MFLVDWRAWPDERKGPRRGDSDCRDKTCNAQGASRERWTGEMRALNLLRISEITVLLTSNLTIKYSKGL